MTMTIKIKALNAEDILSRSSFDIIFFIKVKKKDINSTENYRNVSAVSPF